MAPSRNHPGERSEPLAGRVSVERTMAIPDATHRGRRHGQPELGQSALELGDVGTEDGALEPYLSNQVVRLLPRRRNAFPHGGAAQGPPTGGDQ